MKAILTLRAITIALTFVATLVPSGVRAANYPTWTLSYSPGTGASPDYQSPSTVLGEPSRVTPGDFGGPVDPFSGPWQPSQLLSIGAGGSVTVRFIDPVFNLAGNPFGLDFSVFTSAAFIITNGDFSGGGITDGSVFGDNSAGQTRVSVSQGGGVFYTLAPNLAPTVDGLFPTDGSGDFSTPMNPALKSTDFAGLDLNAIRGLYAGSAGGTGYDIGWARDTEGNPVSLDWIDSIRVDVISGRSEIDGFAAVPEPSVGHLLAAGSLILWLQRRSRSGNNRRSNSSNP